MVNINCPVIPDLAITGTGKLQVQLTGAVTLNTADAVFEYDVDPDTFANGFIGVTATADASQNNVFTLNNGWSVTLRTALDAAEADNDTLAAATGKDNQYHPFSGGANKLENYLKNWAQTKIKETLDTDQLSAFLTAEEIKDLEIASLSDAYDASITSLGNDLSQQDNMAAIAYQFKETRWLDGSGDSVEPVVLPFKVGDSLTFQFNVTSSFTIDLDPLAFPTGTGYFQDASGYQPAISSSYAVPSRVVNVVLNFAK